MMVKLGHGFVSGTMGALLTLAMFSVPLPGADVFKVEPANLKRVRTIDERFQSYNIEMVEVTGGRFWAPYGSGGAVARKSAPAAQSSVPGLNPSLFRTRPPIDLSNTRLRRLAAALGPAYMRVSGTWANSTYFQDSDEPAPSTPPAGFGSVLTRQEWRGVVEFSRAVNAKIVTSFAISPGARDASGTWSPEQAQKLVAFTRSIGGSIAAAELFNEPTFAAMGGAPKGYDAAAYGRDFSAFVAFARKAAPDMLILGPGSLGEASPLAKGISLLKTEDMLAAAGRGVDAFSYHFYGAVSKRCASMDAAPQTLPENELSEEWLSRTERDAAFYEALRDRFEPGKPVWLTETAEAACGGDPWASSFIDSFRYLDQLGRLAKRGIQVVAHNTLAASDYGLIDEATLTPRPNYWSALLWRRLMGTTVLDAGIPPTGLHLYSHCLRDQPGGVALLAINTDRQAFREIEIPTPSYTYTLTAHDLLGTAVYLNGNELKLGEKGALPEIKGEPSQAGRIRLAPASIEFLAIPDAGNSACLP